MWQKLLRHFESPPVDPAVRQRLAVAVLLLECARADFDQSADEIAQVRSSLQRYFGLDAASTADVRIEWADGAVSELAGVTADQVRR